MVEIVQPNVDSAGEESQSAEDKDAKRDFAALVEFIRLFL